MFRASLLMLSLAPKWSLAASRILQINLRQIMLPKILINCGAFEVRIDEFLI
jgi:hypothetical protein